MKKLFIITLAAMVSACACFECEDEVPVTTYRADYQQTMNCDYFDGKTCYRYVYKSVNRPVVKPAPVRYRQCGGYHTPCANVKPACNSCNTCNSCDAKVSETREPVEVVYKKTTRKTVFEPKTYSQVSYESVPYDSATKEHVEVVDDDIVLLDEVK